MSKLHIHGRAITADHTQKPGRTIELTKTSVGEKENECTRATLSAEPPGLYRAQNSLLGATDVAYNCVRDGIDFGRLWPGGKIDITAFPSLTPHSGRCAMEFTSERRNHSSGHTSWMKRCS
jgi:hypothetical protein